MEIVFNNLSYIENKKTSQEMVYLNDVNMVINKGTIAAIISNDLKVLGEILAVVKRPSSGELKLDDVIIKRTSHVNNINELRKKIGVLNDDHLTFLGDTVKDEIKNVMKNFGYKTLNVTKHIVDSLKLVGLNDTYLDRDPNTLSYTERKKLRLASIMSYNPEVLILDNFTRGLIQRDKDYFKKLFLKLKNKFKKTIILTGNDLAFTFELVDNLYVINKGKLVISGDKDTFYDDKLYEYVEMPPIVAFTKYANSKGHNILEYTDIKELIKELYRNVK